MSRIRNVLSICTMLLFAAACNPTSSEKPATSSNPPLPYKIGYLKVDQPHEIYYQVGGNPEGIPVMVLHGGPGGSCGAYMFDYFDLNRWNVVLHDQRGAGKSRPKNELKDNNTQALVRDIEALRNHLGLNKVVLFGGSWGSTLALAYAETYPENVSGIILRGVFTATKREIDDFYHGGTAAFFPETYERLQAIVPHPEILNYPQQLLDLLQSEDPEIRSKAGYEWARYETRLVFLNLPDKKVDPLLEQYGNATYTFSLMENWYMAHNCFLEEGQLLEHADRIAHIPTIIVHGRYDMVCRPRAAWELVKRLENCKLWFVPASGHASSEPAMTEYLKRATRDLVPLS